MTQESAGRTDGGARGAALEGLTAASASVCVLSSPMSNLLVAWTPSLEAMILRKHFRSTYVGWGGYPLRGG